MIIEKRAATKTIATLNDLLWMLKGHSCYPEYSKAVRFANKAIRACVRSEVVILEEKLPNLVEKEGET